MTTKYYNFTFESADCEHGSVSRVIFRFPDLFSEIKTKCFKSRCMDKIERVNYKSSDELTLEYLLAKNDKFV